MKLPREQQRTEKDDDQSDGEDAEEHDPTWSFH
jgi:hypothetical protein